MMYEPVIGLEIHIQLKTKSKMFCGCRAHDSAISPNTHVCPICLGHPGVLPVPNEQAIRYGVLVGLALNCQIANHSKFDRKNYFYPDLPKAYQISQFDLPIAEKGHLDIEIPGGEREAARIGITRAHLEEDAAKSFHHEDGNTFVDFNRGGTPLVEIVTEPDFRSPREANIFLHELRLIARYLGVSDADMEKGHLRCDANISLRRYDDKGNLVGPHFNPKTEVKNLNSFKHVERALEHEIQRQTKLWEADTPPLTSTTRGWNDAKGVTEDQRSKEDAADYRYFPEPDIPPLKLKDLADELRSQIPELPAARRARFASEYKLKPSDAKQICEDPALADFVEHVFSELHAWMNALPEMDELAGEALEKEQAKLARTVSGWLLSKLGGLLSERSIDIRIMKITPENFAEFITLIATHKLNNAGGLKVLSAMLDDGSDPSHIMEDQQLGRMDDEGALSEIVSRVVEEYPAEVARYRAGEKQLLKFLIGMVMKASEGTADAAMAQNLLLVLLEPEIDN
ncbi:Asp-tRNA(Asn)/Glu-tRNA(Gln) amidotransferase GatCAB subunit B [Candidatus Uhrbacteria bacterium CG_4_9_14_3_um_filter_50_9]|uniref:Aspartyl/glutamyl-tRNA(Asn/Gln) amidotransferase subunit B n=1 Tax=Candidatus Uhrbacteria bacterium CG_4_9_14_3_um_filter_50_9 TaxID=1975035 RepID=A0A2M7XB91_9BACT|nr:MAG: Asp-tRNA(Asn)/Glu-tRNA(Gln) amidotransferase GatCAB subunit B [Candidatus Uhrbacteria bacterium CG_4_9_14_3_um_filter_50_9]